MRRIVDMDQLMRTLALLLTAPAVAACAADSRFAADSAPGATVVSGGVSVSVAGGAAAALGAASILGAMAYYGDHPIERRSAPLAEERRVNEQDCTRQIVDYTANLRCR